MPSARLRLCSASCFFRYNFQSRPPIRVCEICSIGKQAGYAHAGFQTMSLPWSKLFGFAVLIGGIAISLAAVRGGVDFPVLYVMGRGLVTGANVYLPEQTAAFPQQFGESPSGMYYPPATGFAVLPLAILPYAVAKWTFAALIELVVVWGVRALVRSAAPQAPAHVWMIAAGVILASAAMRWGMMLLQVAPFVLGLLCWFVSLLDGSRPRLAAGVAMLAVALKMTLALPFLGLLVLRRRWGHVVLIGVVWLSLNALGYWRMGTGSFQSYQRSIAVLGELGNIDSPDLWQGFARPRLDWVALFYTLTGNLTVSRATALALTGACALWLMWFAFRCPRPDEPRTTAAFLGALVCLGSLGVYHHQYDLVVFFAPALLGLLLVHGQHLAAYALTVPLVAMMLVLPIGKAQDLLQRVVGLPGVGLLKLSFPVAITLALVGCLLLCRAQTDLSGSRGLQPSTPA
jgi:Glycosyltransferase family 87